MEMLLLFLGFLIFVMVVISYQLDDIIKRLSNEKKVEKVNADI